jgi:hypothetical protein
MVENILYKGEIIARIIGAEELDGPFKFFTEDGRWNHPRGYVCKPHVHNLVPKTIERVQEAILVLSGELKVKIFTLEGKPVIEKILRPLDICHTVNCGHGYEVMTEDTKVLEFKNGPFPGDKYYDLERTLLDDPQNFYKNEQV